MINSILTVILPLWYATCIFHQLLLIYAMYQYSSVPSQRKSSICQSQTPIFRDVSFNWLYIKTVSWLAQTAFRRIDFVLSMNWSLDTVIPSGFITLTVNENHTVIIPAVNARHWRWTTGVQSVGYPLSRIISRPIIKAEVQWVIFLDKRK